MERFEVLNMLQDIIQSAVDNDEIVINNYTTASDIDGWDSLAQVMIVGELQNRLGVKFTSKEVSEFENVGDFLNAIMSKL